MRGLRGSLKPLGLEREHTSAMETNTERTIETLRILARDLRTRSERLETDRHVLLTTLKEAQARLFIHEGNSELYERIDSILDQVEGLDNT